MAVCQSLQLVETPVSVLLELGPVAAPELLSNGSGRRSGGVTGGNRLWNSTPCHVELVLQEL